MRPLLVFFTCCAILTTTPKTRAGLYHPDVLGEFDIDENGKAVALSPDSFFLLLNIVKEADWNENRLTLETMRTILELLGYAAKTEERPRPTHYLELTQSIATRKKTGWRNLSPEEKVAFLGDLLRLRMEPKAIDEALGLLSGLSRRPPEGFEFQILALYSYALLLKNEWGSAFENADSAIKDYQFPERLRPLTKDQLAWYQHFEREYHVPFLRHRKEEARGRSLPGESPGLDPLFPSPISRRGEPLRFVGESGQFETGTIAEAERAKIPPDALAIVQQLVLWYPSDDRLMWQLAELYNAMGDLRTAARLFEMCVKDLKPKNLELRDHRSLVLPAAEQQAAQEAAARTELKRMLEEKEKAEQERKQREELERKRREVLVGLIVGLVVIVLVYWQLRELVRRLRGRMSRRDGRV